MGNPVKKEEPTGERYNFAKSMSWLLAFIPWVVGAFLDALLGTLWFPEPNKGRYVFALILSAIPLIVGMVAGAIVQLGFNLPMYLGYYFLDLPINKVLQWASKDFAFTNGMTNTKAPRLNAIYNTYAKLDKTPSRQMQGIFGFMFGVIPQAITFLINYPIALASARFDDATTNIFRKINRKLRPLRDDTVSPFTPRSIELSEEVLTDLNITEVDYRANGLAHAKKAYHDIARECRPDKTSSAVLIERFRKAEAAMKQLEKVDKIPKKTFVPKYRGMDASFMYAKEEEQRKAAASAHTGHAGVFAQPKDKPGMTPQSAATKTTRAKTAPSLSNHLDVD